MIDAETQIGRRRERWVYVGLVCSAILLLTMGVLGFWFLRRPDTRPRLGNVRELAVGWPIVVKPVPQANRQDYVSWTTNLSFYLVRPSETEILAFVQRDPRSSCPVSWQMHEQRFIDPCHGSAYTITGSYVRGPSNRDLRRVPVQITRDGEIVISNQAPNADLAR
ncbi:MAG TPA: hypothetical protein VGD58_15550 [Herpetosiphonaceae bacterium]